MYEQNKPLLQILRRRQKPSNRSKQNCSNQIILQSHRFLGTTAVAAVAVAAVTGVGFLGVLLGAVAATVAVTDAMTVKGLLHMPGLDPTSAAAAG